MKFLIEARLQPHSQRAVVEAFEKQGPNRTPGVQFVDAWIGTRSDVAFVVVDAANEGLVSDACQRWSSFAECTIHPVVDVEHF